MKLPTFNHNEMEWDAWKAFHVVHKYHAFVQFDTGEFVVCYRNWHPDERQVYRDLHIQIVSTADDDCPRLYIPGQDKLIPKSHLDAKGMQVLLLDLDHKRAVGLGGRLSQDNAPSVPTWFFGHHVTAYYHGPDTVPVGTPVTRHHPYPLTVDQRRHTASLVDACKVWLQMQPDPGALHLQHRTVKAPIGAFVESRFSDLTAAFRTAIAVNGFDSIVKSEHPWLSFDEKFVPTLPTFDDDVK